MIRLQSSKNLLSHYKFKIVTSVEWHSLWWLFPTEDWGECLAVNRLLERNAVKFGIEK